MDANKIVDYVMHTPMNTNPAVLKSMLESMAGDGSDSPFLPCFFGQGSITNVTFQQIVDSATAGKEPILYGDIPGIAFVDQNQSTDTELVFKGEIAGILTDLYFDTTELRLITVKVVDQMELEYDVRDRILSCSPRFDRFFSTAYDLWDHIIEYYDYFMYGSSTFEFVGVVEDTSNTNGVSLGYLRFKGELPVASYGGGAPFEIVYLDFTIKSDTIVLAKKEAAKNNLQVVNVSDEIPNTNHDRYILTEADYVQLSTDLYINIPINNVKRLFSLQYQIDGTNGFWRVYMPNSGVSTETYTIRGPMQDSSGKEFWYLDYEASIYAK